jgi:uncharacterized glyoxalase superfamily metalloenzyme YdcJ
LESKIEKQNTDYLNKEKMNEEKRKQFEKLREMAMREKKDEFFKKTGVLVKILEKNKDLERKKIEEYERKQELVEKQKNMMESMIIENQKERKILWKIKEVKILENRKKNEE